MTELELDDIDKEIIRMLQDNSRIAVAEMAREIGELTENAIRYRIEKLESEGYISKYGMRLNPTKFGKNVIAIFNLNVLPEEVNNAIKYLKSLETITEIYLATGKYSIIAVGFFKDNNELSEFVTENLKNIVLIDYDVITVLNRIKHEVYSI